ncbi:MAG: class I SAM-dependent methyltransferase, partial [Acidobacteria bacterium]
MAINPTEYWTQRHQAHDDLRGVGNIGCSEAYNRWMYRAKLSVFRREALCAVADPGQASVLDIGSGRGSVLEQWARLGCRRIVGSDFAGPALTNLRRKFPDLEIMELDVAKPEAPFQEEFDAVSAIDVLYHLMDEPSFNRALKNVFRALRPGGVFIFSDMYSDGGQVANAHHTVSRPWHHALGCLSEAGFTVERRRPQYVLMENPRRSRNTLVRFTWKVVSKLASRGDVVGSAVGATLLPFELIATRVVRSGPGLEIFTCRKP